MAERSSLFAKIEETVAAIQRFLPEAPSVGVILGSGLSGFAEKLADLHVIPYHELPHFPTSSVAGHPGRLAIGRIGDARIVAMQGRVHAYEGYAPWQVALPARVLCRLGISALVVTNAAGGVRSDLLPADLMRITDHINLSGMNPLVGPNEERLGPRFPDMSRTYDPSLGLLLDEVAKELSVPLKSGVYAWLSGPSYETPAEIRMLRTLGADAVGMSTVPEVIAAAHMGVPVVGISCITNLAAGIGCKPLSHEEVAETAERVKDRFSLLLSTFLPRIVKRVEV
jgi:purine-nucleoside phosphorylase